MNCPNCGAPMTLLREQQVLVCDYCQTIHLPEPNLDQIRSLHEEVELDCPVCRQSLVLATVNGIYVKHCPQCLGNLFDQGTFRTVLHFLRYQTPEAPLPPRPFNPGELKRKLACPSCGKPMSTHAYGGPGNIVIDTCLDCSLLWLDHTELHRAIVAPGRDRLVPPKELRGVDDDD